LRTGFEIFAFYCFQEWEEEEEEMVEAHVDWWWIEESERAWGEKVVVGRRVEQEKWVGR